MAPLNPTINPTNDPNYRGYSDAIKVPDTIKPQGVQQNQILPRGQEIGDRSAEFEGKREAYRMAGEGSNMEAYGDLFKNITQIGDFIGKASVAVTKKSIEDKVYQVADREREEYTKALEKIKQTGVSNILNPSTDGAQTPEDVENLGDTLTALKSAKDAGKISSEYYWGRLREKAKAMRAEHPGFKNEIDAAFARVTGQDPANAYMRALVTDINRGASQASSEMKKAENFVAQRNGYPRAAEVMQYVRSGQYNLAKAMEWAAPYEQEDYQLKRRAQVFNDQKLTKEAQTVKVKELFDFASGVAVNRMVDTHSARMGINSAEDASKLISATEAKIIPQQQWVGWGQQLAQDKTALALKMNQDAHSSGAVKILGQDEVNNRIKAALMPMDMLIDRIYNKDVGGYTRLAQDLKGINETNQKSLLTHPKLGPYLQTAQALKEIGGEQNLQKFALDVIKGDYAADLKTYMTQWKQNVATQVGLREKGVVTFNDWIDDIKAKGIKDKKFNNAVLKEVEKIYDPTIHENIRMNYAEAAFSPGNRGMISKLSPDTVDSKGNTVAGQSAVFQNWTSPAMTNAMFELGKKNPQVWKNYTDWASETLRNELINTDINTLAEIRNPAIRVGWDSNNKRFVPKADVEAAMRANTGGQTLYNPQLDPEYLNVVRATNRMNSNLSGYKNIAEAAGIDAEAFILKTIASANPEALQRTDSIPYQILRDIGLSKQKGIGSK